MKKIGKLLVGLMGVMTGLGPTLGTAAVMTPHVETRSAVVVNQATGQVLADKAGNRRLPIASLSKLVVAYLVAQQIKQGKLSMDESVKVPTKIAKFTQVGNIDTVPLSSEHPYTVRQLLAAALLPSGNGAAMTLAQLVAGSQSAYNRRAEQLLATWGIKNVTWYSAAGLSVADLGPFKDTGLSQNAENQLSAREVALVARHLIHDFPQVLTITEQKEAQIPGLNGQRETIKNSNQLVGNQRYHIRGLKTGQTPADGTNLVTFAQVKQQPIITVTLNTGQQGRQVVFSTTLNLLQQVDEQTQLLKLKQVSGRANVAILTAKTKQVPVKVAQAVPIFVGRHQDSGAHLKIIQPQDKASLPQAPFTKGSQVGQAKVMFKASQDDDFLQSQAPKASLVASKKVSRANWLVIWWRNLGFN